MRGEESICALALSKDSAFTGALWLRSTKKIRGLALNGIELQKTSFAGALWPQINLEDVGSCSK